MSNCKINLVLFFLALTLFACRSANKSELNVSAAVSLKGALQELSQEFEKENPGSCVRFNFAASGVLAQQILQGAPADLFISASVENMAELKRKKLVSQVFDLAANKLVLVKKNKTKVESLSDLKTVSELAIGNPKTVPAGTYARRALEAAGIYESLLREKRLRFAEDAKQVLAYVESGNAEAGLVYRSDALLSPLCHVLYSVPLSLSGHIVYQLAETVENPHHDLCRQFSKLVLSDRGKAVFNRWGFASE